MTVCSVGGCVSAASCRGLCKSHYMKARYQERRQDRLAYAAEYRKDNKDKIKLWWAANHHKKSEYARKYISRLTPDRVARLRAFQDNRCATCDISFDTQKEQGDHCHSTGLPRGLLCNKCNRLLGSFEKNRELFPRFLAYLENPPARQTGIQDEAKPEIEDTNG